MLILAAITFLYVDPQLSNSSPSYDPVSRTCVAGTNTAFPNLAAACAAATPGATIFIRGATYNEPLVPRKSGTPGNYITFKNYNSELVYLAFPGAHSPAIDISGCSYVIIDGLRVEDKNTYWLMAEDSHFDIVQNCVFKHSPATGTRGNVEFVQSDHNSLLNNVIEDGQDNFTFIESDHNLAQGNTVTQARHSIFGIRCGSYNMIRSNFFSNPGQKIGEIYDCGRDTHMVSNSFNSTAHNVIEDNIFALTSTWHTVAGGNGIQYAGQKGIIRRNIFYDCNVGIGMQVYDDEARYNTGNRIYNNDFYSNVGPGIATWPGAANNIYLNNILFGNRGCIENCTVPTPGQIVYRASMAGEDLFMNNDLFFQTLGQPVMEEEFESGHSVAEFTDSFPGVLLNTHQDDPQFANAPGHDFHLQPTSPMIDTGAFLTATTAAGNGTNVGVLDASYFQDGLGIPGMAGDEIQLGGQSQIARITHVDYAGNILTVDRPLRWQKGQPLSLPFSGRAPDIGAFEYPSN
ncbi:MAG TPA: NosD domain-containing protein [Verrucomicrobiae bacterium]|nr:NosD domain-containing protein [Verrucomicrobiae bacterium]